MVCIACTRSVFLYIKFASGYSTAPDFRLPALVPGMELHDALNLKPQLSNSPIEHERIQELVSRQRHAAAGTHDGKQATFHAVESREFVVKL